MFRVTVVPVGTDPGGSKPVLSTVHVPGTRGKCV